MARANPINSSAYPISSEFTTIDSNSVSSPTSAGSATGVTIGVPGFAAEIFIFADEAIYISENSDFGSHYYLAADTEYVRGVGNVENVYVKAVDPNASIYFMFALIN